MLQETNNRIMIGRCVGLKAEVWVRREENAKLQTLNSKL